MPSRYLDFLLVFLLSLILIFSGLLFGAETISLTELFDTLHHQNQLSVLYDIIITIRLPRTLSAFTTGALLAFSGCLMQMLFQNPLADSYLLGTSSGASLGMLIAVMLGFNGVLLPLAAAFGAFCAVLMILLFAYVVLRQITSQSHTSTLLLSGVMLTAMINAILLLLLTLLPDQALRSTLFWIIGDLTHAQYWPIAAVMLFICLLSALLFGNTWNILAYGSLQAKSLGVSLIPVFLITILLIGLSSGISVSIAGPIGFVGLVCPHIANRLTGYNLKNKIPLACAVGGCLLVFADIIARTIAPPIQLPIGIFTMLIGAPCFLILLCYRKCQI